MKKYTINILIVDDHEGVLQGTTTYISKNFPHAKILSYTKGQSALAEIAKKTFDIYIYDIELKDEDGISLIKKTRAINPDAKIIVYTMHEEIWYIKSLQELKVNGIVLKEAPLNILREAVAKVLEGDFFYCQRFKIIKQQFNNLNPDSHLLVEKFNKTEIEIIKLIAKGYTSKKIAQVTHYTLSTIMSYKKEIFKKFKVNSAPELIVKAIENGFPIK